MIDKTKRHERDAAENVLKFNDMSLSFLCESHSQAIKLINRIICNVYFNNAQKHVDDQVPREIVEQFKRRPRKQ